MTRLALIERLTAGSRWAWISERFREALPPDIVERAMSIESQDRLHEKQGRSTARVRFDSPSGSLSVYLKRHTRLPLGTRLRALFGEAGSHSPGGAEWRRLERARELGLLVPESVAAAEWIGPGTRLSGFLMVRELSTHAPLHEAVPDLFEKLDRASFAREKRRLALALAEIASKLHAARLFHKDLYLCHFFLDERADIPWKERLWIIDFHRLEERRILPAFARWKDLAQLLYSSEGVRGIDDRDRLRFWKHYRKATRLAFPKLQLAAIKAKAGRYAAHNQAS